MYFRESRGSSESSNNIAEYIIDNAQPSDTGTYSCVAQNSAGPVESRMQLIVSEDGNEISEGEAGGQTTTVEEENKTTGSPRGDIAGPDENTGVVQNTKPEEDLVNIVGSKAVLTCKAGMCDQLSLTS